MTSPGCKARPEIRTAVFDVAHGCMHDVFKPHSLPQASTGQRHLSGTFATSRPRDITSLCVIRAGASPSQPASRTPVVRAACIQTSSTRRSSRITRCRTPGAAAARGRHSARRQRLGDPAQRSDAGGPNLGDHREEVRCPRRRLRGLRGGRHARLVRAAGPAAGPVDLGPAATSRNTFPAPAACAAALWPSVDTRIPVDHCPT